jgi:hypothetical protein
VLVELSPAVLARFSLSADLLRLISTKHVLVSCRVINRQTQAMIKKSTVSGQDERFRVNLEIDGTTAVPLSMLSLPEGQYDIHYRIMQYVKGAGVVDDLICEGTTLATLQKGQVTEISIP